MERIGGSLGIVKKLATVLLFALLFVSARAQVIPTKIRTVTALPATCNSGASANTASDMVSLVTGTTSQIYYCSSQNQWTAVNNGSAGLPSTLPNCAAAGTILNEGVQFSTQTVNSQIQVCGTLAAASSQSVVAVCSNNCGTTGNATLVYSGLANAILDGPPGNGGDYIIPSATAGQFTDIGASKPSGTVETFGIVTIPNAGGAGTTAQVYVQPLSLYVPGSGTNSGNVNNGPQFRTAYYFAPGTSNVIGADVCSTDGSGNQTCVSLTTNGAGTGTVTYGNGANPAKPASGNSRTFTDLPTGNFHCINGSGTDCMGTSVDVRVGYGNSGGVDCTGATDSTSILQTMINNAPDFTKFVFPVSCKVKVTTTAGSPVALTIQSRYGLEFWSEGRNANSCDTGGVGVGGARIIDSSTYVAGSKIFYVNQSQRLLFHNLVVESDGAVDTIFDVDQTTNPPITTQNQWENLCLFNNTSTRNSSFNGMRFSNTANANVEMQWVRSVSIGCSNSNATSATSNGNGILFGGNANQKNELVDGLLTRNCSSDLTANFGSDFTFGNWMMSNSWTNLTDGIFNSYISGVRSENATAAITVTNAIGPHTYIHNDFSGTSVPPINCNITGGAGGCASLFMAGNETDSTPTGGSWFSTDQGNADQGINSSLVAFNNRFFAFKTTDFQNGAFVIPNQFFNITSTWPILYAPPLGAQSLSNNFASPEIVVRSTYGAGNTSEDYNIVNIPTSGSLAASAINASTLSLSSYSPTSGIAHWLAFAGNQAGLNLVPLGTPGNPTVAALGTTGAATYTYQYVAHGATGTVTSGTGSTTVGNNTLTGTNFNRVQWPAVAGATYYDVYRTACGGTGGICLTNPTGKIGTIPAARTEGLWWTSNGNTPNAANPTFQDTGISGDGTTAPVLNSSGQLVMATQAAPIPPAASGTVSLYADTRSGQVTCNNPDGSHECIVPQVTVMNYGAFADGTTGHTIVQADINNNTQWLGCGTVNTSGTAVTWVSGAKFYPDLGTYSENVNIGGANFTVSSVGTVTGGVATSLTLTATAGTQTGVRWCEYAVGDQWDYVAIQEGIFRALGAPGVENSNAAANLNKQILLPKGWYEINKPLNITHGVGVHLTGQMRYGVKIIQNTNNVPILVTNGFSESRIEGIFFMPCGTCTGTTSALVEISWDNSGVNWTQALQGDTFQDNVFSAEGAAWQIGLRVGGGGFQGSENLFLDDHWFWFTADCLILANANALQNTIEGGNFQNCSGDAIHVTAGTFFANSIGFQNGTVLSNPAQTGCDINILNSSNDQDAVENSRSESQCFINTANSPRMRVNNNHHIPVHVTWLPNHTYTAPDGTLVTVPTNSTQPIQGAFSYGGTCTSGGSEPTWTYTTTSDGTCTWTYRPVQFINSTALVEITNNSDESGGGIANANVTAPGVIMNNSWSRGDWLGILSPGGSRYGNNTNLLVNCNNVVYTGGGPNTSGLANWTNNGNLTDHRFFNGLTQCNFGTAPLIFSPGGGGIPGAEIGIGPAKNPSDTSNGGGGILAVMGAIPGGLGTNPILGRVDAFGTNIASTNQDISSGRSTGNITPTITQIYGPVAGASGSTLQALVQRLVVNDTKQLTSGSATTLVSSTIAADQRAGGLIRYFIEATDTTNHHNCTLTGEVSYVAENTAATVVANASAIGVPATACDSTNTLTVTWAESAATPSLTQMTPTLTGFTATQFQVVYSVESYGQSQTLPTF